VTNRKIKNAFCNRLNGAILGLITTVLLSSCSIEIKDVELPSEFLQSASEYGVRGKNSVFDDKQLNYGPYTTETINRGGVGKESIQVFLRDKKISQEMSFTMVDDSGLRSSAQAVGVVAKRDKTILDRWLRNEWWYNSDREYANYFAGKIEIVGLSEYEFVIPDAYDSFGNRIENVEGVLRPTKGAEQELYKIATFNKSYDGVRVLQNTRAYLLLKGNVTIGALQTSSPEKIWINQRVSEQDQFIAANFLGLIVLRQDLKDN